MKGRSRKRLYIATGQGVLAATWWWSFWTRTSGKPIQLAVDALGKPQVDDKGMVRLEAGETGPHLQIDVFGTGFLVRRDGRVLTNHHVAEPWWNNDELKELLDHGRRRMCFPTRHISLGARGDIGEAGQGVAKADVATLKPGWAEPANAALLELDERNEASVSGEPVVLIGYPTGIEGILARAGSDVTQKIADSTQNVNQIMSQLAAQKLIRPTTTQGHIGDVLQDKIVLRRGDHFGGIGWAAV